ncbi:hypothetical protein D3C77_665210 [compost metagenome]
MLVPPENGAAMVPLTTTIQPNTAPKHDKVVFAPSLIAWDSRGLVCNCWVYWSGVW